MFKFNTILVELQHTHKIEDQHSDYILLLLPEKVQLQMCDDKRNALVVGM